MDANVKTKVSGNRRTKYIIVGLLAVIGVLSFQLYKQNNVKKELVRRKSFFIGKLYDCKVSGEKSEKNYKDAKAVNVKLQKNLEEEREAHEESKSTLQKFEDSRNEQTQELKDLQKSLDKSQKQITELKKSYDNAMSSVKEIQGKFDNTIVLCNKHKVDNELLNQSMAAKTREVETCKQEKWKLQEEKQVLAKSEQTQRDLIAEMQTIKSTYGKKANDPSVLGVVNAYTREQDKQTGYVGHSTSGNSVLTQSSESQKDPAQNSKSLPEPILPRSTESQKQSIKITPSASFQRPTSKQSIESAQVYTSDKYKTIPTANGDDQA